MTIQLTPSVLNMGGNLVEVYKRETQASEEVTSQLGIDNSNPILATVGIAGVPEFIVLELKNLNLDEVRNYSLSRIKQAVMIKSLITENGANDKFKMEIFEDGSRIFYDFLALKETPRDLSIFPLRSTMTIKITAKTHLKYAAIILQPVSILDTLVPDEDLPSQ